MANNTQMSLLETVSVLKQNNEDFNWYPTTDRIIDAIKIDLLKMPTKREPVFMDIGCGDGRVLMEVPSSSSWIKLGIEKSMTHIRSLDPSIVIVGRDVFTDSLIDKRCDYVYSNPDFSVYEPWMVKVINECIAGYGYFTLPARWENSLEIKNALKKKGYTASILLETDFLNADRKARCKVHLVKICMMANVSFDANTRLGKAAKDWFDENFKLAPPQPMKGSESKESFNAMVKSNGLVDALVSIHDHEVLLIQDALEAMCKVPSNVLDSLGMNSSTLAMSMTRQIENIRVTSWKRLFDNTDNVRYKLSRSTRYDVFEMLELHFQSAFNRFNAHCALEWLVKNCNEFIEKQFVSIYESFCEQKNVKAYKSNQKTFDYDQWQYLKNNDKNKAVYLDYRLIKYSYFAKNSEKLSEGSLFSTHEEWLNELLVVFYNLGYDVSDEYNHERKWESGKPQEFYFRNHTTGERVLALEFKAFKAGSVHIKINQQIMCDMNIMYGRLSGWIRTYSDAVNELGIDEMSALRGFKKSISITGSTEVLKMIESPLRD